MPSIGSIIGGGFELIRTRPGTVAVWAVLYAIVGLASRLLIFPQMAQLQLAASNPEEVMQRMVGMIGPLGLVYLLTLVLAVVMVCAAYRAVLRPSEGGLASLRIGADELRMAGLFLLLILLGVVAAVILMLLVMLVTAGAALAGGRIAGPLVAILAWLVAVCGGIFVWVRLSLVPALTFAKRRISLDAAWSLTRGHFWMLFGAYFLIGLITMVMSGIATSPFMGSYFSDLSQAMQHPEAAKDFQATAMQHQLAQPFATVVLMTVLSAIVQAVSLALGAGATATATRELLAERGESTEDEAYRTAEIFD